MKIDEILISYINEAERAPREIGRYWASDINAIVKRYLTPKSFFSPSKADITGCKMMITGSAFENMLQKVFEQTKIDCIYQDKKEIKITDEITLVAKPDFVFPDFILETKFPFSSVINEIPERYVYQLECYYRAYYKNVYLGVLSIPFSLKCLEYTPSKRKWEEIQRILINFHEEVKVASEKMKKS